MLLTARELRVAELVTRGMKNSEISKKIHTTQHVIKNVLRNTYDKLGLDNRVQLAMWYIKNVESQK